MLEKISANLSKFTLALKSGKKVECNKRGQWFTENGVMRAIRWIFGWEDRVLSVASAFNKVLDNLERIPVKFNADAAVMDAQKNHLTLHLDAAAAVMKQVKTCKSSASIRKLRELSLKIVALKYRIEKTNGGQDIAQADLKLYNELEKLAMDWKKRYPLYQDKSLCLPEKEKLAEACLYPDFIELLKSDKALRVLFFKWTLRDNCEVSAFIQFPATSIRLKNAYLAGRIGRFVKEVQLLKWKNLKTGLYSNSYENVACEKDYVLPFEVQADKKLKVESVSILKKRHVINSAYHYKRTTKQIIATFANRNNKVGNFEMMGPRYLENGTYLPTRIANYNGFELGAHNPKTKDFVRPNFTKECKNWWKQIPPLDTMDFDEVQHLYGVEKIKKDQWIIAVCSSREDIGVDIDKSHGYLDVLIPNEMGKYELYPFGKYAADWPKNFLEKVLFVTATLKSKVTWDENHFMGQRQHAVVPWVVNEKDGLELMEYIRQDLLKAQKGNIVFQLPWENCAYWSQNLLEKLFGPQKLGGPVPNFFRTPLLQAQPKIQPLPQIFRFCRQFSGKVQATVVKILELILCSWRGTTIVENGKKVFKSVPLSPHMNSLEIFLPSNLHQKIINKSVSGKITMGMMSLNQTP